MPEDPLKRLEAKVDEGFGRMDEGFGRMAGEFRGVKAELRGIKQALGIISENNLAPDHQKEVRKALQAASG